MTQELLQIIAIGLIAVFFGTVLKKHSTELSILLALAACLMIGLFFLQFFKPILSFTEELRSLSGLDEQLLEPILKCLGIGLLTQICSNISIDSGQSAIAKMVEISGSVLALYVSLPLFNGIIEMIRGMGGGK